MKKGKCLEYYMDAKQYNPEDVQKSIDETKKEFSNKKVEVDVSMNQFGVYIITFYFQNKNHFFNKIKIMFRRKETLLLGDKKRTNINIKPRHKVKQVNQIINLQTKHREKAKNKIKIQDEKTRLETYYGERRYGQYKETKTYRPI